MHLYSYINNINNNIDNNNNDNKGMCYSYIKVCLLLLYN